MNTGPAFAALTPDEVLDALDAVGVRGDGRILQLNSYENRVYQVMLEDGGAVVAKFYRPRRWTNAQIVEEHRFALELAQAEVPVVAPLALAAVHGHVELEPADPPSTLACRRTPAGLERFALAPRRAGRAPDLEDEAVLTRLGGFIGRLHAIGGRAPFRHRLTLDPPRDARAAVGQLQRDDRVPPDQAAAWTESCRLALEVIDAAWGAGAQAIRLHGDCHPGNLLWRETGAHVVDLDDCCNGPAVQDLWMLLSGDPQAAGMQLRALLRGYEAFADFDRRQLRLIDALRLARMIRHNAWVAQRYDDPAFPAAWPDFGSSAYWAQQCVQLREQVRLAAESPPLDALL
jgi:Ser/Thr protein kinase RdoA (MazF antagonist)